MHRIHEDKGIYDFLYQLPQIAYSSLISLVFGTIFEILALSGDLIINFKQEKIIKMLRGRIISLKKNLKLNFY